jgi:hypothetical protein
MPPTKVNGRLPTSARSTKVIRTATIPTYRRMSATDNRTGSLDPPGSPYGLKTEPKGYPYWAAIQAPKQAAPSATAIIEAVPSRLSMT